MACISNALIRMPHPSSMHRNFAPMSVQVDPGQHGSFITEPRRPERNRQTCPGIMQPERLKVEAWKDQSLLFPLFSFIYLFLFTRSQLKLHSINYYRKPECLKVEVWKEFLKNEFQVFFTVDPGILMNKRSLLQVFFKHATYNCFEETIEPLFRRALEKDLK